MLSLSPTAATLTHTQAKAFDQQPPDDMPDDAAAWLRAHFDWTRGAVWVASERWQVDAVTIVAWAERLRCGGARAGLGSRERGWIHTQVSDTDNAQPTRAELARARVTFAARELAGDLAGADVATTDDRTADTTAGAPVLAIRDISDAIALVAARLVSDVADGETAKAPFRALLLDDLRILRATGIPIGIPRERAIPQPTSDQQPTDERQPDEQIEKVSARSMASHHTQPATYETREAQCALCGNSFTARKYSNGWTRYCSATCSGKARFAARQTAAGTAPTAAPTIPPTTPAVSAPAALEVSSETPSAATPDETAGYALLAAQAATTRAHTPAVAAANVSTDDVVAAEREATDYAQDYALLHTLLDRLPTGGQWSAAARARYLAAFTALLDYLIETQDEPHQ